MNITTIGLDIAKNVFQIHGVDANGKTVLRKQLKPGRSGMLFMPDINMRKMSGNEKMLPDLPGCYATTARRF